jgi:hypothetical protein
VWAGVSYLNVVFGLQRNCIFFTTRCAIGILATRSAVQNQRLTLVLTIASRGSTWDLPWIGTNRPFIFFPRLVFVSYCLVCWECMLWWRKRNRSFCLFWFCCLFSALQRCWRKLSSNMVSFICCFFFYIRSQRKLEVLSNAAACISPLCMCVTPDSVVDFICVRW